MVELVDSVDLGAVTSGKVFLFRHPHRKIKYAGMMELADMQDLGAVTSVKVFPSRCHCEPVRRLVWQSVL